MLTKEAIEALEPSAKRRTYRDGKISGLSLEVHPTGKKVFKLFYRMNGRAFKISIGVFPDISLAQARVTAQKKKHAIAAGENPALERRELRRSRSITELIEPYLEYCEKARRRRSVGEKRRILERYVSPHLGSTRLSSLERRDVIEMLDHVQAHHGGIMANRVLAEVRAMLNWALHRAEIEKNCAAGIPKPAAETARSRVLTADELKRIWRAAEALGYPYGHLARLLMLTGQRLLEVAEMKRSELVSLHKLWIIPGGRTKNGLDHEVPLSALAQATLESAPTLGDSVLCSGRRGDAPINGFSAAKKKIDKLLATEEPMSPWTWHDLRRSFRTGLSELGIAPHIAERALNHVDGGVRRVYDRHSYREEKRDAFNRWSVFIESLISDQLAETNVIQLKTA